MVRNNRVVIRNTQLKIGVTHEDTVFPANYPRIPVSLAREKLPSHTFEIWNGMSEFIYDDQENECSTCQLHSAKNYLNLGVYHGLIDPKFK